MKSRLYQRLACVAVAAVLCAMGTTTPTHAQQTFGYQPSMRSFKMGDIDAVQLRDNVWMIAGAGGNIVAHVGWMGIVLVDTGSKGTSEKVLAALDRIAPGQKIRFIIDTSALPDHVGGQEALSQAGRTLLNYVVGPGGFGGGDFQTNGGAAGMMAHENVLEHMAKPPKGSTSRDGAYPSNAWPVELYNGIRPRSLYLNGDGVTVSYQPGAISDSDSFVAFRRTDVIAAGDILDLRNFPVIDTDSGGTINGTINALTRLIEMSIGPVPLTWHADRTLIVPGHGRICDQGEVVEYRDMLVMVRDRIQDLVKKGRNLEQIKAANVTEGFNKQYGSDAAMKDAFITAVHKTLNVQPKVQ